MSSPPAGGLRSAGSVLELARAGRPREAWTPGGEGDGPTFEVRNPATGETLALVPDMGPAETRLAIDAAARAFDAWAGRPAAERAAILLEARELMRKRGEQIARLIALEEGKPIVEARGEVGYAADFLGFYAREAELSGPEALEPAVPGKRVRTVEQPVGVAGIITIWNFPAAGVTRPLGAALAAGCTAVLKPAEQAPLTAAAIFELLAESGLPPGVACLVTTSEPAAVARELLDSRAVRKLNFTGSAEVGKAILRESAAQVKRVTLELGGNAPFIVFADADLDAAAADAVLSKFRNAGQTCVALNRLYVERPALAEFTERFVSRARRLRVGDPLKEEVQVGPLIDAAAVEKVEGHVEEAAGAGATILLGGSRFRREGLAGGSFFEPTVLSGVTPEMRVMREETFGPVAPIAAFHGEEEVLARANELPLGLAAYVYTRDPARAERMAARLEYGIVGVNDPLPGTPQAPFGGVKESGIGKEGGRLGIQEFLETKLVSTAGDPGSGG